MPLEIAIEKTGILNKHVLLALSGGADSVALFFLLNKLRKEGKLRLTCAHFEHGIRGEASIRDRDFVSALAKRLDVPLIVESGDVPAAAREAHEGLETAARRMRYDFLYRAKAASGADVIALAHHKDDRAETILMHLFRGGGLRGAVGMRYREGTLVRPLLDIRKQALIDYLNESGEAWREDETNFEAVTPRNALRLEAMPTILSAYPGALDALCRFSEIARAEDAYMDQQARLAREKLVKYVLGVFRISLCPETDEAILRRVIRLCVPGVSFEDVERIKSAAGRVSLADGLTAETIGNEIFLALPLPPADEIPLNGPGAYALNGVCRISIEESPPDIIKNDPLRQTVLPLIAEGTCLRTRRNGDFIRPLGMNGQKKLLSDVYTDKKIPQPFRNRLPLIARDSEVLWALCAGISESVKISKDAKAVRLQISINGGNEYEK